MAVPKYFEMYHAFLTCLADGREHTIAESNAYVIDSFHLTEADLAQLQPSGNQGLFSNRMGWCGTYLSNAGCIERAARSVYRITDRGMALIEQYSIIDDDVLMQFPEFVAFKKSKGKKKQLRNPE